MVHGNKKKNDQIAGGSGKTSSALGQSQSIHLFFQLFSHDYTQHQLFAILVLRQFLKTDYRGIIQMLKDFSDLREVLGIKKVPHYSTLCYAEKRLLKKKLLKAS